MFGSFFFFLYRDKGARNREKEYRRENEYTETGMTRSRVSTVTVIGQEEEYWRSRSRISERGQPKSVLKVGRVVVQLGIQLGIQLGRC